MGALGYGGPMDIPEGAEGHSVVSDGVGALIEGPKVAISQTRLYLDGAPGMNSPLLILLLSNPVMQYKESLGLYCI